MHKVQEFQNGGNGLQREVLCRNETERRVRQDGTLTASWDSGLFCRAVPITHSVCFVILGDDLGDVSRSCNCFHIFMFLFVRSEQSSHQQLSRDSIKNKIDRGCSRFALSISCTSWSIQKKGIVIK